jgi:predicted N-acetyltransferase YhbS
MIIVRKGKSGELDKIVKVANAAFEGIRFKGFDFKQVVPKVYDTDKDTSDMHFVAEDAMTKEIIAVAGHLINNLEIDNKTYKYSILGSLSTIPSEQNKGYMKKVINAVDQECKDENLVFSMLVGDRKRYNYFNYEICGFRYEYVFSSKRYQDYYSADVRVSAYQPEDLDDVYKAYLDTQVLHLRDKENFQISFKKHCILCKKLR